MNSIANSIFADFKQRTRQQNFVVALIAMAALTFLFFPAPDAHYQTLVINGYRGIYNSAWLGVCLAMLNVLFLPLICFYLVKNAIELDRRSMTCELIAATPLSKQLYLFSKWSVNVLILVSIVMIMLLSSIVIQLFYGESYQIDLWALIWPQLVFVFPLLLTIASIALMFEVIKPLKNGLGNIVYFFLWIGSIVQSIESVSGIGALLEQLENEVEQRFPQQQGSTNIGINISDEATEIKTFIWQGIEPSLNHVSGVIPLLLISLICFVVSLIFFDRFSKNESKKVLKASGIISKFGDKIASVCDQTFVILTQHFTFTQLLRLELKILLKGHSTYWFVGLSFLNIVQVLAEQQLVISIFLPLSWLWCVVVISALGQQEKQSNTFELMTYSKQSVTKQSLANYSAAWVLLALASMGSIIRFVALTEWLLVLQLIIAISFTVSLAYFCGTFTKSKRMFEVLYPAFWYMGPIQAAIYFDFFGVNSEQSWQFNMPLFFITISLLLLTLTIAVRKRR